MLLPVGGTDYKKEVVMVEIDKDKVEKLSDLAEICSGQEIRLTREDVSAIRYARDILINLTKNPDN